MGSPHDLEADVIRPRFLKNIPFLAQFCLLSALFPSLSTQAQASSEASQESEEKKTSSSPLKLSGYGDILLKYADYGADPKASARGAKRDQRTSFDLRRFVLEWEGKLPRNFEFEAELEIEHGGTGSAVELEYEEAGEYENEVEKAGEVRLEKLVLKKEFEHSQLLLGQIPVALGLLAGEHEPLDFFGAERPESEEHLLPTSWSEGGIEWATQRGAHGFRAQLLTGLDSTGFSSQYFVARGQQQRFDSVRTSNPAAALRWTLHPSENWETGVAFYYGDSAHNRPQPDLIKRCGSGDGSAFNSLAPCGYIKTPLWLSSWHLKAHLGPWQTQSSVILGKLDNAVEINTRNAALSQKFTGILRSPVASQAYAAWTEWGYALPGFESEDELLPFIRLEAYDTVWKEAPGAFDQARLDRRVWTLGARYVIDRSLFFKLDTNERRFGDKNLRREHETRLNVGFIF